MPAADYTLDMDMDKDDDVDMDTDVDTDNSPTFSMAWSSSSQAPSTPQSLFSQTALTPQSSGSSFSQTFGGTPCPANNAFAPLPVFSADMDGVVFTAPRAQPAAATRAPPRANGVVPFSMQPTTTAMQLDPQQKPAQPAAAAAPRAPPRANGVLPFSMQPAPQQNTAQPAAAAAASGAPPRNGVVPFTMQSATPQPATAARPSQPGLSGSRFAAAAAASAAAARRPARANGVLSFNMQPAASAPQLQAASQTAAQPSRSALPSGSLQAAARAASAAAARGPPRNGVLPFAMQSATPSLPAAQPSQSAAAAAASAAASRALPRNGVLSFNMQPPTTQQQASQQPATEAMDAQPSQPAAFQPTFSQPAQTAQPQGLFGATPFRHASFWAKNDPGQVFKTPSWPMTISSLWAAALPHLSPKAQLGDMNDSIMTPAPQPSSYPAPSAQPQRTIGEPAVAQAPSLVATKEAWASTLISAKNDPAQVFKAPSWLSSVAVAPLWKTIQTLPQLAPGTQLWDTQDSIMTAAPQLPPSDFSKQVLPAAPVPSRPQSDGTGIAQQSSSIDNDLEAAVDMMASLHVSEPETWAWTEATGFSPFIGKDEGKDYDIQMLAATMQLPDEDNDDEMNEAILQQQIAQEAAAASTEVALPHASGTLPAAEANGSSSVAPVQEQPAQAEAFQQKPSGSQPIDQTPAAVPAIAQAALTSGIPTQNGSSDEAMTTEASQPTDKGKGVAGTYQIDFTDIKFQVGNAGQLMDRLQQINNPFANSPSSPATIAPTSLQLFGQQIPLSVAPTANGAASQEQPYEVGSDEDPNVDPDFDFGNYFRRSAPTAVASASSAPDASASSSSAEPSSAGEPATSAAATPPTEASPSPEVTLPDAPASSQAVLPVDTSSPVEPLSIKAPPPAEPFAFVEAPAVAASPLDEASFALAGTPSAPRGINKRRRDIDTYLDPDRPAEKVSIGYETRPMTPEEYDALWKEWAGDVVAELKANPAVLYSKEYAMEMMYNMFHTILPRVASEVMYPVPLYTQRYQDKQAQALMDAMTVEELYEKSYEMVEEMFEPTFDLEFPASRWNMFYLFSDWFVDYIAIELPDLPHRMEPDEIKELGKAFLPEIYNYMDAHPPEDRD